MSLLAVNVGYIVAGVAIIVVLIQMAVVLPVLNLYFQAMFSNAKVDLFHLIGMRLRKTDARTIVFARIRAMRVGMDIPVEQIESHYLAGGHVGSVVNALIACDRAGIDFSWNEACAIDLAGIDVQELANRVIRTRAAGRPEDFEAVMQEMAESGDPAFHRARERS
ncbi:MAG: flotillin-like FloA family protein [Phycisphaeraceae bacterium]|nr:flotillin-like FloA family protein [Phycisphaerales bacterium]MCB9844323.1 flotillin-like FloA family protein [Phycisphaeraceae bacterium]